MKNKTFVRSTKCSFKFNSSIKKTQLNLLLDEYTRCLEEYISFLWCQYIDNKKVKIRFLKADQPQIETFLSARILNSCINHASSIVRSRIEQIQSYQSTLNNLNLCDKPTQKQLDYKSSLVERITKMKKVPVITKKEMRLDSKNSKIFLETNVSFFDLVVELYALGMKKFNLMMKKHKHFNNLLSSGRMMSGMVICEDYIQFNFEFEKKENTNKKTLGVDIGINSCLTTSDNTVISSNDKGKSYHIIMEEIVRKRKGSKAFNRKLLERDNCVKYCVKQLDWKSLSSICVEDIKNLRKGKKTNKIRRHWNYRLILDSLKSNSELHNVCVNLKNPMYTSQRCSSCGYVNKKNRENIEFLCLHCGFAANADYNASLNLQQNLHNFKRSEVPSERKFFWDCNGIRRCGEEFEAPLFTKLEILV